MSAVDPFDFSSPDRRQPLPVGSKVRIIGEAGEFLVVRVDAQRHTADLLLMGPISRMETGVRLLMIEPVTNGPSMRRSIHIDASPASRD